MNLAQACHEITVVTPNLSDEATDRVLPDDQPLLDSGNVTIHRFAHRRSLPMPPRVFPSYVFGNPMFHRLFAGKIARAAAECGAQLLVAQGHDSIAPVYLAGRRLGLPAVATLRDYRALCPVSICLHRRDFAPAWCTLGDFMRCLDDYHTDYRHHPGPRGLLTTYARRMLEWRNTLYIRSVLPHLDGAMFVSRGIHNIFSASGLAPENSEVVYNLPPEPSGDANPDLARTRFELHGKTVLLFVGRFSIGKGAQVVEQALPLIRAKNPNAVVVVAGNREYRTEAEGLVFTGHVGRELLDSLYASSFAVILPSRWPEPFSRVLLEASFHQKPVIATCAGGNSEAVIDNESGYLVLRNDPEAFANACLRLLELPLDRRNEMGTQQGRLVREKITGQGQIEQLVFFFNRILLKEGG